MVEPSDFSEVFEDCINIIGNCTAIDTACQQAFYCHRYHTHKVAKLNKYLNMLTANKSTISKYLSDIQSVFDNIETEIIIFQHNLKRVQDELLYLAELQADEIQKQEEEIAKMTLNNNNTELSEKEDIFS